MFEVIENFVSLMGDIYFKGDKIGKKEMDYLSFREKETYINQVGR